MTVRCIRDCFGDILLAGIKAWGLPISEQEVREGMRLFEDDDELVRVGESVGVPRDTLVRLPAQLRECPGYLNTDEARQALARAAAQSQIQRLAQEVGSALGKVEATLRQEAFTERFTTMLATLAFLAIWRFCPDVRRACRANACLVDGSEVDGDRYADAVARDDRELTTKIESQSLATPVGQGVVRLLRRHARRLFTLAVAGDHFAVVSVLADIFAQVVKEAENAHN